MSRIILFIISLQNTRIKIKSTLRTVSTFLKEKHVIDILQVFRLIHSLVEEYSKSNMLIWYVSCLDESHLFRLSNLNNFKI